MMIATMRKGSVVALTGLFFRFHVCHVITPFYPVNFGIYLSQCEFNLVVWLCVMVPCYGVEVTEIEFGESTALPPLAL
jgi:hypothetical protein